MKAIRIILFTVLSALLLAAASALAEYSYTSSCPQSFRLQGIVNAGDEAAMRSSPGKSKAVASLKPGTVVWVTGIEDKYFRVELEGNEGYVRTNRIRLTASAWKDTPEAFSGTFALERTMPSRAESNRITFSGELRAPAPVSSFFFIFWDERQLAVESVFPYLPAQPVSEIGGSAFYDLINASQVSAGRKTLVIQGTTENGQVVLARLFLYISGNEAEPAHITGQCTFSYPWSLADDRLNTVWKPDEKEPSLTVGFPEGAGAALVTLEWSVPPESCAVRYLDAGGALLSEETLATGFYLDSLEPVSGTASVRITPEGKGCALATVRVYPERYASFAVQKWEPLPEKVDLMLFSTHQDDEVLFFGGMIPWYSAAGKTVAVTYMTNCGRGRYREALDGLWTAGLKYHPVFLGWADGTEEMQSRVENAYNIWRRDNTPDPLLDLVRLIRRYRPEVVVTHDFDGEYGNIQHRLTAKLIPEAAELAADPAYDADFSTPWTVKKCYIHLYKETEIMLDWDRPLSAENPVFTPRFLAEEAYDKHRTQHVFYTMKIGELYDNRCFGLYSSAVGPDILKNDLFENIP